MVVNRSWLIMSSNRNALIMCKPQLAAEALVVAGM